jgi:hypothetical protein
VTRPATVVVLLALGLWLAAGACGSPTEPNTQRIVGRIDPSLSSRPVLWAPQEVRAGVAFLVTVTTVGSGCTAAEGGGVEIRGDLARIVPYDREPKPGHTFACAMTVTALPRDLRLKLSVPGTTHLRVVGMKPSNDAALDSLDVTITVRP